MDFLIGHNLGYGYHYTAAKGNLAKITAKVCDDHAPVIIMRKSVQPVDSFEEFTSVEEAAYLLRSPKNKRTPTS